jgi:hypothetical protein
MPTASTIPSVAFSLATLLPAMAGWSSIKVTHKQVEVEHKSFEKSNPPKELTGEQKEGAVTISEFDLKLGFGLVPGEKTPQVNGKCRETLVVQAVNLTIGLKITVWLPDDAPDKLKAHEEGHVQMAEKIYAEQADKAARAAGALVDGRRLVAEADNCADIDKAVDQTIDQANKKVYQAYLSKTADLNARAGEIYDDITHHGTRLDIDEKTAAAQAFAREAEEEKRAATRPAAVGASTTKPSGTKFEKDPMKTDRK